MLIGSWSAGHRWAGELQAAWARRGLRARDKKELAIGGPAGVFHRLPRAQRIFGLPRGPVPTSGPRFRKARTVILPPGSSTTSAAARSRTPVKVLATALVVYLSYATFCRYRLLQAQLTCAGNCELKRMRTLASSRGQRIRVGSKTPLVSVPSRSIQALGSAGSSAEDAGQSEAASSQASTSSQPWELSTYYTKKVTRR